jgi:hypothetical protein
MIIEPENDTNIIQIFCFSIIFCVILIFMPIVFMIF